MYSIFINLQTCIESCLDCLFSRKHRQPLLEPNHYNDIMEHYIIYNDEKIQD